MRMIVFLHGTTLRQRELVDPSEEVRGEQSGDQTDLSAFDFESFVPVGKAVEKLRKWRDQGAEILYLSSHRNSQDVEKDRRVMTEFGFPPGPILYRGKEGESYAGIAEKVLPDLIVEDDCLSIGGKPEMTYPNMSDEAKKRVKTIVVKEHGGIDHLPDDLKALMAFASN